MTATPTSTPGSGEPTSAECHVDGCRAGVLAKGLCLAHIPSTDLATMRGWLGHDELNARGVVVAPARLRELLAACRSSEGSRPELPPIDFGGARFSGDVDFEGAVFTGSARFSEAVFHGRARFGGTAFLQHARFRDAVFHSKANLSRVAISGAGYFAGAEFRDDATFSETTVGGNASFSRAAFRSKSWFVDATFTGAAAFRRTTFGGLSRFHRASFRQDAEFGGAAFKDGVEFKGSVFDGRAQFASTAFAGDALYHGAVFNGSARFGARVFGGRASFVRATFADTAVFGAAKFLRTADFSGAVFHRSASFGGAEFAGPARYGGTTFHRDARFDNVAFATTARFAGAEFGGEARFRGATCGADCRFQRATFRRARTLGPLRVAQALVLDGASFEDHVRVVVTADRVTASDATFGSGTRLEITASEIELDNADFARPSTLHGIHRSDGSQLRLIDLAGAHVAPLVLSNVDVQACRFFGAHGVESMRIEASCSWSRAPKGGPSRTRETIAEEHWWRAAGTGCGPVARGCWRIEPEVWISGSASPRWATANEHEVLQPTQIATIYRALRKAREDGKDEAGAGDLYYGEMEMRRLGATSGNPGERALLTAYWLVSGYGLRASRALGWLAVVLTFGAALLDWFGFHRQITYGRSLLFALESSISLLRPPDTSLSAGGQMIQIGLRLSGPLLFGLAALALRARVRR